MSAALVLAGESDKSGPIGLAVILVLCAISYLLFRSMSGHMRKVRENPPGESGSGESAPGGHPQIPGPGADGEPAGPDSAPTSPAGDQSP